MLQENTQLNQDKTTSFEQLKVGLRSLIATDDLEPEQARLLFNAYGDKLKNDDPELYSQLSEIILTSAIIRALKNKINGKTEKVCFVFLGKQIKKSRHYFPRKQND